jgi:hypothetical protein
LLSYMIQDILLLAGIMLKAQEIISTEFGVDIVEKITVSSLALTIFRTKFYDDERNPIHIPSGNEDNFIRRAYYGGHSDVYIPYMKDGHYYDVNSLYPYIMAYSVMPIGKPRWHGNLSNQSLDEIYGFVEAYVVCPLSMRSPYLPYREKDGSLTHPVGEFFGVYYTEELKKAREVGYRVEPLRGYLFEKGEGLFTSYVLHMYENRIKAKEQGKTGMSFVYKILMNGLYGRLGINQRSTITELCSPERYNSIRKMKYEIVSEEPLNDTTIICSYWYKPEEGSADWYRKLAAVQMSAAITAGARIHMYPHISREDCYYTDTDSVVVKKPLPPEMVCNHTLGKFKLEHIVKNGYFIAPKSYCLFTDKGEVKIVHKGAVKPHVTREWFEAQLYNIDRRITKVKVINPFRVDRKSLEVKEVVTEFNLGLPDSTKRERIYNDDGRWVDTKPAHVELKEVCDRTRLLIERLKKHTK